MARSPWRLPCREVWGVVLLLVGVVAGVVLYGCSAERDYETLSLFFDEVPNPHAVTTAPATGRVPTTRSTMRANLAASVTVVHKPYEDKAGCAVCHTGKTNEVVPALDNDKCLTCHKPVLVAHTTMHEAVTDKACLWCHAPHTSGFPHLLRNQTRVLCMQCHDDRKLSRQIAAHGELKTDCLSCHLAHGGKDRRFLRDPAASTAAATQGGGL